MKLFIRNVLLFVFSCLSGFIVITITENWILNRQGRFQIENSKKYIFLGHSHAQMAYDDGIIDSSLNQASSGESYFYSFIKLRNILSNNPGQKIIFVEFSNNNIMTAMDSWIWDDTHILNRYKLYTPYSNYEETKLLLSKNPKSTIETSLKAIVNNLYYIIRPRNIKTDSMMGGYVHLVRDKTDSLLKAVRSRQNVLPVDTNISVTNIEYLKKIIELCRKNGDAVYLVRSPLHPEYDRFGNEFILKELLKTELTDAEFLDFRNFPLKDSDYGDLEHVNYRGAKKYSLFFNRLLKSGLLDSANKQQYIDQQMSVEKSELLR